MRNFEKVLCAGAIGLASACNTSAMPNPQSAADEIPCDNYARIPMIDKMIDDIDKNGARMSGFGDQLDANFCSGRMKTSNCRNYTG